MSGSQARSAAAGLPGAARAAERGRACAWRRPQPAAGVVRSRHPRVRWPVLAVASLVQTIPGLALLALFYPLLLALSACHEVHVRHGASGARLPALAAGPDALFDAADPAQRRRRAHRPRSGRDRGGGRASA